MATKRLGGIATSSSVPDNGGDHSGGGGSAGGASDDVFSTYLYTGNGSIRTITNGIDLAGEGGLVWIKSRTSTRYGALFDTERGPWKFLYPSESWAETNGDETTYTPTGTLRQYNSDGFELGGSYAGVNGSDADYVSWTFRKAKNFFDVVKYAGASSSDLRTIPHNLGVVPGMIILKNATGAREWVVWHKDLASVTGGDSQSTLCLNSAEGMKGTGYITNVNDKTFLVADQSESGSGGNDYIAYVFAHDDSDESIIKCGIYSHVNGADTEIYLGWEPQFAIDKPATIIGNWNMFDVMRGWYPSGGSNRLNPNTNSLESQASRYLTSTGFSIPAGNDTHDGIYMAIRRPTKHASELEPEELFDANTYMGNATTNKITNTVDFAGGGLVWIKYSNNSKSHAFQDTVRGVSTYLFPDLTSAESRSPNTGVVSFDRDGFTVGGTGDVTNESGGTCWSYSFRRAPGFFDVVAYTGNGTGQGIPHNLGVAPEMMWIKRRNFDYRWTVYYPEAANEGTLELNADAARSINPTTWNSTAPTATHFTVGTDPSVNYTHPYIAYLFASVPGISKVGSYTGNGGDQDIDCGFTNGARFVLIKRTDDTGDWVAFDYERGIVANGFDPYVKVNTNDFAVSNYKMLNPYAAGFSLQDSNPLTNMGGGQYIFYAIA